MLLGLIRKNNPSKMFCGYVDREETKTKIIKGVYQEDDEAYVTGNIYLFVNLFSISIYLNLFSFT